MAKMMQGVIKMDITDKIINYSIAVLIIICFVLVALVGWDFTHG
jgi:hypothetical protein